MTCEKESGNALWFILLAIALLAALTFAISRSSDSVEGAADFERLRVEASELIRTAAGIEKAVNTLRLRGIAENDISFENSVVTGYANSNCTSTDCLIFDPGGVGLTYNPAPNGANDGSPWLFTGGNNVEDVGTDGSGTSSSTDNEILIILPNVKQALCTRINAEVGISGIPADLLRVNISEKYTGSFIDGETISPPDGEKTGCFQGNQNESGGDISGNYYFFHTLVAR